MRILIFIVLVVPIYAADYDRPAKSKWNNCPESCMQPKDAGSDECSRSLGRWYFNTDSKKCQRFEYSGCDGNANRFTSKQACLTKCAGCQNQDSFPGDDGIPNCDCSYKRLGMLQGGGCKITVPPPQGYKCKCNKSSWLWSCSGVAQQCDNEETCPANCSSRECCFHAIGDDGNCDGYDMPKNVRAFRDCILGSGLPTHLLVDQISDPSQYSLLNHQWNIRLQKVYPVAYFLPRTTPDVQWAVRCGFETKIPVAPNSGGHSYELLSYGTNQSVVIDFRNMQKIHLNPGELTVDVQPGALIGMINKKLWENGGYAISVGSCQTVGIGGHAIGGGEGYLVNIYGTALDNVLEMEVVTADGTVRTINSHQFEDLYWACRGMGPGYFAIVTRFKIRMYEASKIKMSFIQFLYPVKMFPQVMDAYQKFTLWVDKHEPTIMSGLFITNDQRNVPVPPIQPGLQIQALHIQDANQTIGNATFLKTVKEYFPAGAKITEMPVTYYDFSIETGYTPVIWNGKIITRLTQPGAPSVEDLTKEIAIQRYHKSKTFFVRERYSLAELENVGRVLNRMPKNNIWLMFSPERGAILNLKMNETAYVHRDSIYQITATYEGLESSGPIVEEGMRWLYEFYDTVKFMDGGQTYQNYPDLDLKDYLKRYYASNLPRLVEVKRKYDPTDYFKHKTSIPLNL